MKKLIFASVCAIGLLAISQQQASAWINSKFSIGLNWQCQSGGNDLLWGLWHNGQPPPPPVPFGFMPPPAYVPVAPAPYPYPPPVFMPEPSHHHHGSYGAPTMEPPLAGSYQSPFHFATYGQPNYYYAAPYYYGR